MQSFVLSFNRYREEYLSPAILAIISEWSLVPLLTVGAVTAGTGAVLLITEGNLVITSVAFCAMVIFVLTMYRIEWGFYLFISMVLGFDQFFIPGFNPWTFKLGYFKNLKETPFFPNVDPAVLNLLELQLLFLMIVWFVVIVTQHTRPIHSIIAWPAAALFYCALIASLIFGLRTGGDFLPALWEVRALFYLGFLFIFVPQVIQTKEQIHTLLWIIIFATGLKAIQGGLRLFSMGLSFRGYETLTNHEDPVFILDIIVFLFALTLVMARTSQLPALIFMLIPLIIGFYSGQRRAAYAAVVPAFATLISMLKRSERMRFFRTITPMAIILVLYCTVFWNSEGRLGSPVRLVKSGMSNDRETAGERYYSNLYREIEKFDLAWTVRQAPVTGIGFGKKYEMPLPLVRIDFPLRDYIPHDEVLWILVKMGGAGFCLFFLFLNAVAFRGSMVFAKVRDPYLKAVCALAVAAIIVQVVVSNFDLQLTYYRNMVLLGTLMGLISTIDAMDTRTRRTVA